MTRQVFSRWLMFILIILSFLTACGGGSDEPSNLLSDTGGNVGGTSPPVTTTEEGISYGFQYSNLKERQQIIPSGGTSNFKLTVLRTDKTRIGQIVPHLPVNISVHPPGEAILADPPKFADNEGNLIFRVSHPSSGNVALNISGRDNVVQGVSIPLYFGATATADVIRDLVIADGISLVEIRINTRDWKGTGISGIPVELALPHHSHATLVPPTIEIADEEEAEIINLLRPATITTYTNATGEARVGISNVVPQTIKVTPIVGGFSVGSFPITFTTGTIESGVSVQPRFVVKSDNVLADGVATTQLLILAQDQATNSPLANIPIRIYSDSLTAQLKIGGESQTFSITGNTGQLGYIELLVTNTVAETVNLTAITSSANESTSVEQAITFTTGESISGVKPSEIKLDDPIPAEANANGTEEISLVGQVIGDDGNPLADLPVSILVSGGSAKIVLANGGKTNETGYFVATFTNTVAEEFTARAMVGSLGSENKKIKFTAIADDPPSFITLVASPSTQIADGQTGITLIARVRDNQNIPIEGAQVEITADSDTSPLIFDSRQQLTDAGGSAIFTATSTAVGSFTVTAQAWVVDGNGNIVGNPIRDSHTINFISAGSVVTNLNVESIDNDFQPATGKDEITVKVLAKNDNGKPVVNAPMTVQFDAGPEARAIPAKGFTDGNGSFATTITSTKAGAIDVSFAVEGSSVESSVTITFVASEGDGSGEGEESPVNHIDLEIINDGQPADGGSKITVVVIPRDTQNRPLFGTPIKLITTAEHVTIANDEGTTNELGEFRTTVTSTQPQTIRITAVVKDQTSPTAGADLTFVSAISSVIDFQVLNDNQPADGESAIILVVKFQAPEDDTPIVGATVKFLSDDPNLTIAGGETDDLGEFRAAVAYNVPGTFRITPVVNNIVGDPKYIIFTPLPGEVTPTRIELGVIGTTQQAADGQAAINLRAVVFDNQNPPVPAPEVDVELISDPPNAQIEPASGKTNTLGQFDAKVTNAVAETVTITPVAIDANDNRVLGTPVTVTFVPVGLEVADLSVTVVNNNQDANGESAVQIQVIARDSGGRVVPNVPIVVQMPTGTAAIADVSGNNKNDKNQPVTDEKGLFIVNVTSRQAGDVHVTISIQDTEIAHPPVTVTFKPSSVTDDIPASTIELLVFDAPQPADGISQITLVAIPRDASGNPMPNKTVNLIADSSQVIIAEESGDTNVLGEFRTTVTTIEGLGDRLTETLIVNITPESGGVVGEPTPVIFLPVSIPIPATLNLSADKTTVEVSTDQENFVTLTVLAWDENKSPVTGVPVKIIISPSDKGIDITGSTIFADVFEGKTDENTGVFTTQIKNSLAGTIKVTAVALGKLGGEPILNSNTVEITFKPAATDTVKEVANITLITNVSQLGSDGNLEGAVITAIVKNERNNLVEGAEVSFEATSGEIQAIPVENSQATAGITDVSGRAQARLTTQGDPDNRTITVKATVPTIGGEIREDSITLEVVGTATSISGPAAIIANTEATFTISLTDSAGNGIADKVITLSSELNNTFIPASPKTNALGQAEVKLIANNAGEDTLIASSPGAENGTFRITISDSNFTIEPIPLPPPNDTLCTSIADYEDLNNNRILDLDEDLNNNGTLDLGCRIPLQAQEGQSFKVHWDEGGINQVNEKLLLSITRGQLSSNQIITDLLNGDASFTVFPSNNAGSAIVTVQSEKVGGPSRQFTLRFVATNPKFITVQANPSVVGVNPVGTETQQSKILAVVRDADNNLVSGQQVEFILKDISGGRITQGSIITDDFGRASTTYIAGPSTSAADGVEITATVTGTTISDLVRLTVAKQSLFVTIGSGNTIESDGVRYSVPHTVLVTDANGTPISDAEVILSVYPLEYFKGAISVEGEDNNISANGQWCPNEDINRNGLLDNFLESNEDLNRNNLLDPGNVITVDKLSLKTGINGYGDFNVIYAIQYALFVKAEIMARVSVAGSENRDVMIFPTLCLANDFPESCPLDNPFGFGACDDKN